MKFDTGEFRIKSGSKVKLSGYPTRYDGKMEKEEEAPWYVVPSERKWFRNLLVTRVICDALEAMKPEFPEPSFDYKTIVIE